MKPFSRFSFLPINFLWVIWLACLLIITTIEILTIKIAPYLHQDEFMIVDLGRIILSPKTDWAITWLTKDDSPVLLWSYLGPVLQEFSFNTFGELGPRISGLLGAILASVSMVFYLLARGTSLAVSLTLSLIFLIDPLFVQSYTMGRVDGWAIAFCMISCYLLATSKKAKFDRHLKIRLVIVGSLGMIAFFIWPSAIFLFPLIAFQLVLLCAGYKVFLNYLLFIFLGGIISALVILLPIGQRIYEQFAEVINGLFINLNYRSTLPNSFLLSYYQSSLELFRVLKFTPFLPFFALLILLLKKEIGLLFVSFFPCVLLIFTLVYIHRVIFLLPYFIVSVATLYESKELIKEKFTIYKKIYVHGPLVIMLIWSTVLSLGIRSALAFSDMAERDRNLVFKAAKVLIGAGTYNVMACNEFYYSGRSLGWRMYSPYHPVAEPVTFVEFTRILSHVDFVILTKVHDKNLKMALESENFKIRNTYNVYHTSLKEDNDLQSNIRRLRNVFSIFQKPYGPYTLYARNKRP